MDALDHAAEIALQKARAEASAAHCAEVRDELVAAIYQKAEAIAKRSVERPGENKTWQDRLDDILTSRMYGIPIMLVMLTGIFWLTLEGSNLPSRLLGDLLLGLQDNLSAFVLGLGAPAWLHGVLVLGMYRTLAWVVAVMLPPMAIFFPMFTLLEDLGYLPRVAFNLDRLFRNSGAHGKQALTMSMGFGCNAVGVIACRIIESPRERLIATLTNVFVPCNGRFPTLVALSTIFIGSIGFFSSPGLASAITVMLLVIIGIGLTLAVSKVLTSTMLKGLPSAFVLELPPFRPPQVLRVLVRSMFDRTIFVLGRAVAMAAPAGALTWILANTHVGNLSLFAHVARFLEPVARILGFDGTVLLAFIMGIPANEIVLPITVMAYMSEGALMEPSSLDNLRDLLVSHGWTTMTAVCVMLFSLLHWPCSTTLWTVHKETQSLRWTLAAALIPTATAVAVIVALRLIVGLAGTVFGMIL